MIKILLLLMVLPNIVFASAPTRVNSYNPNTTISSSAVTENENALFNYLQAGVDVFADASIFNADISPSANIQSDKLNLTSVAQNIANTGTFTNTGNVGITGTTTVTGNLVVTGSTTTGSINTIPQGVIVMWSGTIATIPTGWELADGTCSITCPDLRNRFIVAADADDSGTAKSTITGSAAQTGGSTTISQANLPSYNLSFTRYDGNGSGSTGVQGTTNGASAQTQNVSSGGSGTAYTQPFYALAYIIKV